MKSWQWKLLIAVAIIYITAASLVQTITLSLTYTTEQHIASVQKTNTANNTFVANGVKALTPVLVFIGEAFTAVCKAEHGCVIPPYPPK